ncbi:hypothetical protein ANN_23717 [Periplaneta americana]|uniref:Reverse transcriptase domain-containing protein n=1 Tax=Periplaneta americana TaxID=6978 RepID=A0ABQ8SN36_PERAM|nr:hypothetical protein ANN_23717 [Periplaneta americana]
MNSVDDKAGISMFPHRQPYTFEYSWSISNALTAIDNMFPGFVSIVDKGEIDKSFQISRRKYAEDLSRGSWEVLMLVEVDPDDFFGNVIRRYRQLRTSPHSFHDQPPIDQKGEAIRHSYKNDYLVENGKSDNTHARTCLPSGLGSSDATKQILEASKAIGLEVNPEKTKYMIMSRDQNIVRNGNIKIGDLSFEEVEKFKYLGATVTNINNTREEIKRRINMGNACYYSVEKLLSSSLLSKNLKVRIYKTFILPVLLYGCETWTLTLREEHRLRVLENKVLRKIFGAKRDEVTGEWRKLHNTEVHALYSSPDIIRNIKSRRLRWAGHVARMGESRNVYRVLVGRPEGKRPLGRPRRRWEDNIKMDLREVGYDDRDWINLAQDRDRWRAYVRAAMNLRVP